MIHALGFKLYKILGSSQSSKYSKSTVRINLISVAPFSVHLFFPFIEARMAAWEPGGLTYGVRSTE